MTPLTDEQIRRIGELAREGLVAWSQRFRAERGLPAMTDADIEAMKRDDRIEFKMIPEERRNW